MSVLVNEMVMRDRAKKLSIWTEGLEILWYQMHTAVQNLASEYSLKVLIKRKGTVKQAIYDFSQIKLSS